MGTGTDPVSVIFVDIKAFSTKVVLSVLLHCIIILTFSGASIILSIAI